MNAYERLNEAINKVPDRVKKMRRAASQINDAPDFERLLDTLEQFVHIHGREPDAGLANEFTALKSQLAQFEIDPEAHDEGMQERWQALDSARGNLYLALDKVLGAARDIGIVPDKPELRLPDAETIDRGGVGLVALSTRLQAIEDMLRERIVPEGLPGEGRVIAQLVQVNQYVRIMRRNITLFGLTLSSGDRIDLSALERVVATMGRLTRDFHASVTSAVSRATTALRDAASAARRPVGRLTRGLRVMVKVTIRRERAVEKVEPPSDLNMDEVHAMILRGEVPPERWRRWIEALDFSGTELSDLTPLVNLTALQSLNLGQTKVTDLTSLTDLTALQSLDLYATQVNDLTPLARLTSLQSLRLTNTLVSDITPLAGLTALQSLWLMNTDVSDIWPISNMNALKILDLWRTEVRNIAPLSAILSLEVLDLYGTKVEDLFPLSELPKLEELDLGRTRVMSLKPLAGVLSLRSILVESEERVAELNKSWIRKGVVRKG